MGYLDSFIDTFQSRKLHPLVTLIIDHYHDVFDIYIYYIIVLTFWIFRSFKMFPHLSQVHLCFSLKRTIKKDTCLK